MLAAPGCPRAGASGDERRLVHRHPLRPYFWRKMFFQRFGGRNGGRFASASWHDPSPGCDSGWEPLGQVKTWRDGGNDAGITRLFPQIMQGETLALAAPCNDAALSCETRQHPEGGDRGWYPGVSEPHEPSGKVLVLEVGKRHRRKALLSFSSSPGCCHAASPHQAELFIIHLALDKCLQGKFGRTNHPWSRFLGCR